MAATEVAFDDFYNNMPVTAELSPLPQADTLENGVKNLISSVWRAGHTLRAKSE